MKIQKIWFTLVELIVVITILAVLSTIWFVSYSWYLAWTRDTSRIASLKAISDWLELYKTKHSLPIPEDYVEVRAWDDIIAYQGYVWKNVLETIEYSTEWTDPKDGTYYSYYLTKNKKYFQLMAFLEEEQENVTILLNTKKLNAIDYSIRYPVVYWKKLWILTDDNNTPIQEISTITSSWYLELSTSNDLYIAHISNERELTLSWKILKYELISRAIPKYFPPKDCPEWFIAVPWNPDFNQKWFCVAQYEMSYDDISPRDSTEWGEEWNTRKYNVNKIPVSMKNRLPIVDLTQEEAIKSCKKIWAHLVTHNEWMTIARNIEWQKENYITWNFWNWILKNWVSNDISKWCSWKQDWTLWAGPTWSDCLWTNRNKLILSNEEIIYDFVWNIFEHINKADSIDGKWFNEWKTSISWSSNWTDRDDDWIYDIWDMDNYGSLFYLWKENWMWNVHYADWVSDNVLLAGWSAWSSDNAGIFSLDLNYDNSKKDHHYGFRCAK